MVQSGGSIEVYVSPHSAGIWRMDGRASGSDTSYYINTNIVDGQAYDVKLVSVNNAGAHSAGVTGTVTASSTASNTLLNKTLDNLPDGTARFGGVQAAPTGDGVQVWDNIEFANGSVSGFVNYLGT